MRVLVAPDKFKGSLSARAAAAAIASGLKKGGVEVDECPLSDGGEGFAETFAKNWTSMAAVRDPLGRLVSARYGWMDTETAVIEMCEASGLGRLVESERNPWKASTFGVGQMLAHAAAHGARRILLGLGGSATNDGGAGAASALGWNFLTSDGEPVQASPENFLSLVRIEAPEDVELPKIIAACDVDNPLLGPRGASHLFARQKGADDRMVEHLEMALRHLADLAAEETGADCRDLPGAGAAGGLGFGLATFCGAELRPGFEMAAQALRLEERIAASDFVITGEGSFDAQTLHGKAPAGVARLAKAHGKPVAIICGRSDSPPGAEGLFDYVFSLASLGRTPEECQRDAAELLSDAAMELAEAMGWKTRRASSSRRM